MSLAKLSSAGNKSILQIYCENNILIKKDKLKNFIEMFLDETIEHVAEKFSTWKPTKENLAELNIEIFKLLKSKIEKSNENTEIDHEAKLKNLFSDESKATKEDSESKTMERQYFNEFKW
jgi:hypothetical protein